MIFNFSNTPKSHPQLYRILKPKPRKTRCFSGLLKSVLFRNLYILIILYTYTMVQQVLHYPRLDTVLNVEEIIKKSKDVLSKNEIDRRLRKKIMRPTLNVILAYLENSGKIAQLKEGIIWIYKENISKTLQFKLKKAVTVM